jgi:hypothetical protein
MDIKIWLAFCLLGGCILYIYGNKLLARIMNKRWAKRVALSVTLVLVIINLFFLST